MASDGGKENNNSKIDEFLSKLSDHRLNKVTALKDIQFSNSPIETIHKIIKGRYLRNKKFDTIEGLTNFLKEAVQDYNYLGPHYKHYPNTPAEIYFNNSPEINFSSRMSKAMNTRVRKNLATACSVCRQPLLKTSLSPIPSQMRTALHTYDLS